LAKRLRKEGSEQKVCSARGILAATQPGHGVVHIRAEQFRRTLQRNPYEAENIIIHEMLHTLGLGENPPAPAEIGARIVSRCGQ
jgi:hypothetical protein